jgi:excisionase family DNA binding protein
MTSGDAEPHELHPFMTVVEVAAALRVSRATIYRLVHAGVLPGIRVGNSVRVPRHAVDAYLRRSTPPAPS